MGWMNEELAEDHEGYAAFVTDDGRTTGTSTGRGVLIWHDGGSDELITWDRVVAWQAMCTCGWSGDRWERAATIPGEYGGNDAEDAYMPDGRSVDDLAYVVWQAHIKPLTSVAAVERASQALKRANVDLDQAVENARKQGASWADIGRAAGITRQSARERWRHLGDD